MAMGSGGTEKPLVTFGVPHESPEKARIHGSLFIKR